MRDFTQLCDSIDNFGYESGLKLNDKKTEALIMDRVKCGQERKTPPRKKIINGQKIKSRFSVFGFQLTQLSP